MTTKVIPAYPSKVSCTTPPIPDQVCVNVLNGQIDETGIRKLGLAQSGTSTAFGGLFGTLSGGSAFGSASSLGEYITSNTGNTQYGSGGYGSSGSVLGYGSSGSLGRYGSASSAGYSSSGSVGGYDSTGYTGYGSGYTGYGNLGYLGNEFGTSSGVEFIENDRSNCDDFGDGTFPKIHKFR